MMRRRRALSELDRDIEEHLAREIQDHIDRGLTPDAARTAALRAFGNVTLAKEATREVWFTRWWNELRQDVRYGFRALRRSRGFTAVAVLTLAVGIGANTVVFSAVNGVLFEHQPYADGSRLLGIRRAQVAYDVTFAEAQTIKSQCPAFDQLAVYEDSFPIVTGGVRPEERSVTRVTADFFPMLGVKPLLGRTLLSNDMQADRPLVAVLSFRFWMDAFGGDPGVIGHQIQADARPYTIVGVMPKTFELGLDWLGENTEGFWVPQTPASSPNASHDQGGVIIAHLAPGAAVSTAQAQLRVLSAVFAKRFPANARGVELVAEPPALSIVQAVRVVLLVLFGAVVCVLLMASVNVSALLVARARTRTRELAIRTALGAGRLRIVRQLLTESLLLAVAGCGLGLASSFWGTRVLAALAPPGTPRVDRIHLDRFVLGFTVAISLLTAVLFGLLPAIQASSRRVGSALKQGLGNSFAAAADRNRYQLRSALVLLEVALAVVLLVSGTLMARSLYGLMHIDTGVRADHVLTMTVQPSRLFCDLDRGDVRTMCAPAVTAMLGAIRALPGVERAGVSSSGPFNGGFFSGPGGSPLSVEGLDSPHNYRGPERAVSPGFFDAMGIRIVAGRDFTAEEVASHADVGIVTEAFARRYIPGNPIGRRFSAANDKSGHPIWTQIVGVVNDVRDHALNDPFERDPPHYRPFTYAFRWTIVARTSTDPEAMTSAVEHVVGSADPHAPVTNVQTVDQMLRNSSAQPRFQAVVMGSFSAIALLLAMIGIYGVASYATVQRTHEIGVRVALGAKPADVIRLVVVQGAMPAVAGIAVGMAGALALTRFLRSLLYEVAPTDPATFAGVGGLLLVVALAACWIPARRASRLDPRQALLAE